METAYKVATVLLLLVIGFNVLLFYEVSPATTAGIQLDHNGKPLNNIAIQAYFTSNNPNRGPDKVGTTDGTGLMSITVSHGQVFSGGSVLYDFNYNGTTYSFSGPLTQIVEVSI